MRIFSTGPGTFLATAALALTLAATPAFAVCGDGTLDEGEDCDGGACCVECSFTPAETVCRPAVSETCDVAEACTGDSADCPADVLVGCSDGDGLECTVPTCNEDGSCSETDECRQICRGPGFWGTHSGDEKNAVNIGQAVIDGAEGLEVCGQSITATTAIGTLDSALEALCVRTQGERDRQLYRHLVATALNCAISEGGDCDDVVGRFVDVDFSACNALCAGDPVEEGPTSAECRRQLACFNKGGRIVEGECALGTCAVDTETACGAAYGACPAIDEQPQDCVRFDGNCSDADLCSTDFESDAQVCPDKKRASSPKACRDARKNQCTIDSCTPS